MIAPPARQDMCGQGASIEASISHFRQRTVQIHPTLTCNLRCAHCYSNSGPGERSVLDVQTLCAVLSDAASLGYETVAISGGEPLLYPALVQVLAHAKTCGLRTTLTTNGTLLTEKRLAPLHGLLDLMAISLDGPPAVHNAVRQSATAFARLEAGLVHVRRVGIPFGFIHTVTRQSWTDLLWTAEFAVQQGARLLQLHPLELTGRAATHLRGEEPDDDLLTRVYLLSLALRHKYRAAMAIQFDAFHRDWLAANPELVYASDQFPDEMAADAADLLGLIVVEADGSVVPISYGFSHQYRVCALRDQTLAAAWPVYRQGGYQAFRYLCRTVLDEIINDDMLPLIDWHGLIVARSYLPQGSIPVPIGDSTLAVPMG